jgi:hypothetical protein
LQKVVEGQFLSIFFSTGESGPGGAAAKLGRGETVATEAGEGFITASSFQ